MKIALVLMIVGFFIFPLQKAAASYGSTSALTNGLTTSNNRTLAAMQKNTKQDYKVKSRKQATQMVKAKYRAKVLSVKATELNGNPGYSAKLLGNDGIVFYVFIDARSGQMKRR